VDKVGMEEEQEGMVLEVAVDMEDNRTKEDMVVGMVKVDKVVVKDMEVVMVVVPVEVEGKEVTGIERCNSVDGSGGFSFAVRMYWCK